MKFTTFYFIALVFSSQLALAQKNGGNTSLVDHLIEFSKTSSVTGREEQAASYIQSLFQNAPMEKDKLGNLILTIGSGEPRRLLTVPLDEPGYVVSEIQEDGYLKIYPIGSGHNGNLYHQFLQGHEVNISTEKGSAVGVSTVPSAHFEGTRTTPEYEKGTFQWQEARLDLGESSALGVGQKGIQLLDPVTLNKKPVIIGNTFIAVNSAKTKSAAIAMAMVAQSLTQNKIEGTVVVAWTALELINSKGIEAVINNYGPFDEIYRFNRFLDSDQVNSNKLVVNSALLKRDAKNLLAVKPTASYRMPSSTVEFTNQAVYEYGLPSLYPETPVELVAISDIENLIDHWLTIFDIEKKQGELPLVNSTDNPPVYTNFKKEQALVSSLIDQYGVSGDENKVRELILSKLPPWAKPTVDSKGNIILTFGQGDEHVVFVAHMDETGYVVDSIKDYGTLILQERGRMLPWPWEAQASLIHVNGNPIHGVFEPRIDYKTTLKRASSEPLSVYAGFSSESEATAAGIIVGSTTVTMPKKMIRLSENRAAARGFDDRVGCAVLLMSLSDLNPDLLSKKVTFIWSVEEETGLFGSTFAAKNLKSATTVYPIDTYVSSDDAYPDETFANCSLGNGAVIRVLESVNFISRENLKTVQSLADKNKIKVQYGMTVGGTDGQAFLGYGIPSIPLSWPGRYSHSPIEVMDYRDLNNLVSLIKALLKERK
ncbi:M28 family peptidase [Mariniflexile sp.]|uniref:M28 family peptidase n=1 Tax=Mariniflexile sp. TaxID=1979402 RepID=UPI0040472940